MKSKNKYTPFKTNGYAKSYTPKKGETNSQKHLKAIKDAVKQEKSER